MNKVLVVEDDEDLLQMVTLMLEFHQFEVKSLSTGNDFLNTVIEEKPDMVVMDIFLAGADGRELCKELKSSSALLKTPVLLYSAGNISMDSIKDSGANDFLHKPFDMLELLKRIQLNIDAYTR